MKYLCMCKRDLQELISSCFKMGVGVNIVKQIKQACFHLFALDLKPQK